MNAIKERLNEAEKLAATDALTNLYNRRAIEQRAGERLSDGRSFCLIIVDLDRFQSVNARFGHRYGDEFLRLAARKLLEQVRPSDVVSRWGGDEFLVLMDCELGVARDRASQIAQSLTGRFPVTVEGNTVEVDVRVTVGVSQSQAGEPVARSFERADALLYQLKYQQ